MAAEAKVDGERVRRTANRGNFTVNSKDLVNLKSNTILETGTVEIAGFKWQAALFRSFRSHSSDKICICIHLFSCNEDDISADIQLSAHWKGKQVIQPNFCNEKRVGCSFRSIYKEAILLDKLEHLAEAPLDDDTFDIKFDLMNVELASECEDCVKSWRKQKRETYTINLEILDHGSISRAVTSKKETQIVPSSPSRSEDVCSGSLVRLWTRRHKDYRYWLCERRPEDGHVIVKGCLNEEAGLFRSFDYFVKHKGEDSWVTLFKEKKESNESFQKVEENTILVFCELWEPKYQDLTYLGHLLVKKTMSSFELYAKISNEFSDLQEEDFTVILDNSNSDGRVTVGKSTLGQCGARSGSIFVIEKSSEGQELYSESPTKQEIESEQISDEAGDGLDNSNVSGEAANSCSSSKMDHDTQPQLVKLEQQATEAVASDLIHDASPRKSELDSIISDRQGKCSSFDDARGDDLHDSSNKTTPESEFFNPHPVHTNEQKLTGGGKEEDPDIVKRQESDGSGTLKETLSTAEAEKSELKPIMADTSPHPFLSNDGLPRTQSEEEGRRPVIKTTASAKSVGDPNETVVGEVTKKEVGSLPDSKQEQRCSKTGGLLQTRAHSLPADKHSWSEVELKQIVQCKMQPSQCKIDESYFDHDCSLVEVP